MATIQTIHGFGQRQMKNQQPGRPISYLLDSGSHCGRSRSCENVHTGIAATPAEALHCGFMCNIQTEISPDS